MIELQMAACAAAGIIIGFALRGVMDEWLDRFEVSKRQNINLDAPDISNRPPAPPRPLGAHDIASKDFFEQKPGQRRNGMSPTLAAPYGQTDKQKKRNPPGAD